MVSAKDIGGIYDVSLKEKLIHSLLRDYISGDKNPFLDPSDLSYIVMTIKTYKLLLQWDPSEQEMDCWKAAMDAWNRRVHALMDSNMADKCWAGISLLAVTCQECSSVHFLASYPSWLNKLLDHIQLPAASHSVKVAAFAALSDLFTRLSRFPNAKKDGTSLAMKVIEPTLKMLNADSSGAEEALSLLCTLMNFFPASIHRHYYDVEAAICTKIMSGKCSASVVKKLSYGLSLLPKSRGDEESWFLIMKKILLSINRHLSYAFPGLVEDSKSSEAGGLEVFEQISNLSSRRPERLLGSKICALMCCCSMMLTSFYPVQVPVPVRGLVALAWKVLLVDGSLSRASFSCVTTLKQEFICSELPLLQLHTLEIITAVIKGPSSQVLPYFPNISQLLTEYTRRCTVPELRERSYLTMRVLLMSMRAGVPIHLIQDVINIVLVDLDPLAYKKGDTSSKATSELLTKTCRKREKCSSITGSFQEQPVEDGLEVEMSQNFTPISVKIAALEVLEALLSVGGSSRSGIWRPDVDHLIISVATNACKGEWSEEERNAFVSGEPSPVWADFQLASLRALLASLLSGDCSNPSHLASGHELFLSGIKERGTKLADFCGLALLALEVLIHPRGFPLLDTDSSINDCEGLGHSFPNTSSYATGRSQLSTFQVGIQGKYPLEADLEDDDLNENWVGNDNNEMEMQVTERQKNGSDAANPLATTVGTSISMVSEEKDLGASTSNPGGGNMLTVESPILKNTKKQRRDSAPSTSTDLLIGAQSVVVTFKPVGQETTVKSDVDHGISAQDVIKASALEHVSKTKNDKLSSIIKRISDTLASTDKSKGLRSGSDDESADTIPDIVDGDPDSD